MEKKEIKNLMDDIRIAEKTIIKNQKIVAELMPRLEKVFLSWENWADFVETEEAYLLNPKRDYPNTLPRNILFMFKWDEDEVVIQIMYNGRITPYICPHVPIDKFMEFITCGSFEGMTETFSKPSSVAKMYQTVFTEKQIQWIKQVLANSNPVKETIDDIQFGVPNENRKSLLIFTDTGNNSMVGSYLGCYEKERLNGFCFYRVQDGLFSDKEPIKSPIMGWIDLEETRKRYEERKRQSIQENN